MLGGSGATFAFVLNIVLTAETLLDSVVGGSGVDGTTTGGAGGGGGGSFVWDVSAPAFVPEPASLSLIAAGLLGLAIMRRRIQRHNGEVALICRRFLALASLSAGLMCAGQANATILIEMDLAGIGSNIDLNSFSSGISGNYTHSGSAWQVQTPKASDFMVGLLDGPIITDLQLAAEEGTHISSGDIEFFKPSATAPYLDFHFTQALVTNVQIGSGGGDPLAEVHATIRFEQVTASYTPSDGSGPSSNPWGAVLPDSSAVEAQFGGSGACVQAPCPFLLDLNYDLSTDAAQFGNSDVVMAATIPGQLPEPASLLLFGSGLLALGGAFRRKLS